MGRISLNIKNFFTDDELNEIMRLSPEAKDLQVRNKIMSVMKNQAKINGKQELGVVEALAKPVGKKLTGNNEQLTESNATLLDKITSKFMRDIYKRQNARDTRTKQEEQNEDTRSQVAQSNEAQKALRFKLVFSQKFIDTLKREGLTHENRQQLRKLITEQLESQGITAKDMASRIPKSFNYGGKVSENTGNDKYLDFLCDTIASNLMKNKEKKVVSNKQEVSDFDIDKLGQDKIRLLLRGEPSKYEEACKSSIIDYFNDNDPPIPLEKQELDTLSYNAALKLKEKKNEMDESFMRKFSQKHIGPELDEGYLSIRGELLTLKDDSSRRIRIYQMVKKVLQSGDNQLTEEEMEDFRPSNNNLKLRINNKFVSVHNLKNLNIIDFYTNIYAKRAQIESHHVNDKGEVIKPTASTMLKQMTDSLQQDGISFLPETKNSAEAQNIIAEILGITPDTPEQAETMMNQPQPGL